MSSVAGWEQLLAALEHHRALLLGRVADQLTYVVPMLGVPHTAADPLAHHQQQIYAAVEQLHSSLQAARLHEKLLVHEFEWAAEALPRLGVTVEHIEQVIDRYVDTAQAVNDWAAAERRALEEIRAYLRRLARATFPPGAGAQPAERL